MGKSPWAFRYGRYGAADYGQDRQGHHGYRRVQAPPAMDPVQVQILLNEMVDDDFLEGNLIFEPDAITPDP